LKGVKTYLPETSLQTTGYSAECFRLCCVVVEVPNGYLLLVGFSATSDGELGTPKLPRFSHMGNGSVCTQCFYTACLIYLQQRGLKRVIACKDVPFTFGDRKDVPLNFGSHSPKLGSQIAL